MWTDVIRFDRLHLRYTCFFMTCINSHAIILTHIWIRIAF